MMRSWLPILACAGLAGAGACAPRAVTPPSRTYVLDSPTAPDVGGTDVQLDAALVGEVFGPEAANGNARLRHTLEPGVSVEVDGGVLHVTNVGEATDPDDRNAYTGRLGVLLSSPSRHWAAGAGLGGGLSRTGGNWGAADIHGMVSGAHPVIRPMLAVGLGYSAPFGERTFMVQSPDKEAPGIVTLRLPRNAFAQLSVGVELGPRDRALIIGASFLRFWLFEDSVVSGPNPNGQQRDDAYLAFGIGVRVGVN